MAKLMDMEPAQINTITHGSTIKGNVVANGDFRLDGLLDGNIQLNGKLVVGETGVVRGNAVCQNAHISGTIEGNISVKELLSLDASSRVKGDLLINKLSIVPGAVFTGTCKMIDEVRRENEAQAQAQAQQDKK